MPFVFSTLVLAMTPQELKQKVPLLELELITEILKNSSILKIPKGQEVIKQDGYIPGIPIVLEGLINVSSHHDDRSLLLYYIEPGQSCIMSFKACMNGLPSQVYATTEATTTILLLPNDKIIQWIRAYPGFNTFIYSQYDVRYGALLDTIEQVLFQNIEQRLYTYLKEKMAITGNEFLKMTHQEIADELGTVREVISRSLKKLEIENKVIQSSLGIKMLSR